jgi:phenylacetate-CoA ligase
MPPGCKPTGSPRWPTCVACPRWARPMPRLVWRGVPGGAFRYNTGGSSGEPLIFHFGRTRQASDAAGRMRARRWWGVEAGRAEAYLWGAPVELNKTDRIKTVRDRLINQLVLNAFAMSPERMDHYLDALQAWQPKCLYGYASSSSPCWPRTPSAAVAAALPRLRVVCTTGEPLVPAPARTDRPGLRRAGGQRIRQPRHRLHRARGAGRQMLLMSESHIVEVLDAAGQPVRPASGRGGDHRPDFRGPALHPLPDRRCVRLAPSPTAPAAACTSSPRWWGGRPISCRACRRHDHARAGRHLRVARGRGRGSSSDPACADRCGSAGRAGCRAGTADAHAVAIGRPAPPRRRRCAVVVRMVDDIPPEASGKHRYVVSHVPLDRPKPCAQAVTRRT